jgi:hypothetical protein
MQLTGGLAIWRCDEYILIFLFAISSSSGLTFTIELLLLSSSSVILLGFSSGLDEHKFQHSSKPLTLCAMFDRDNP